MGLVCSVCESEYIPWGGGKIFLRKNTTCLKFAKQALSALLGAQCVASLTRSRGRNVTRDDEASKRQRNVVSDAESHNTHDASGVHTTPRPGVHTTPHPQCTHTTPHPSVHTTPHPGVHITPRPRCTHHLTPPVYTHPHTPPAPDLITDAAPGNSGS